ncbi:MAG: methionine adenosyltransferase [Candidatus Omnitrophica bacterium]|nr:methionine adenosyltransferase [Candidatus Omnitrophota bacterium]
MRKDTYLLSSESVTEGHPDKVCDQISDAVLDAIYRDDPNGRVACETLVTTGLAVVAGEITTSTYVDIPSIVRQTIKEIGYTHAVYGFDFLTCGVVTSIQKQSPDIALGVDTGGAGDQGMMFGYATNETKELMPMPISLAHKLSMRLAEIRKQNIVGYLRPDGKTQVTVQYKDGRPHAVTTVIVSAHHDSKAKMKDIRNDMIKLVIDKVIPKQLMAKDVQIFVNPTGRFEVGGPQGDTGVTGRKIIVDTYGGVGSHGGGAFSGKDPSKVDRSASYMARYVAKNIVASGLATRCEIQIAYAIGVAEPVSVMINTFGTGKTSEENLVKIVRELFPLTPKGIIEHLKLRRPIYRKTAAYGHFGREDEGFSWEEIDKAKELQRAAK